MTSSKRHLSPDLDLPSSASKRRTLSPPLLRLGPVFPSDDPHHPRSRRRSPGPNRYHTRRAADHYSPPPRHSRSRRSPSPYRRSPSPYNRERHTSSRRSYTPEHSRRTRSRSPDRRRRHSPSPQASRRSASPPPRRHSPSSPARSPGSSCNPRSLLSRLGPIPSSTPSTLHTAPRSPSPSTDMSRRGGFSRGPQGSQARAFSSSRGGRGGSARGSTRGGPALAQLPGPLQDAQVAAENYRGNPLDLKDQWRENPKTAVSNYVAQRTGHQPVYDGQEGLVDGRRVFRCTVVVDEDATGPIEGVGDASNRKEAEKIAALSACYKLLERGWLDSKRPRQNGAGAGGGLGASAGPATRPGPAPTYLSDGKTEITFEKAREFMDYYCQRFGFGKPDIHYEQSVQHAQQPAWGGRHRKPKGGSTTSWDAVMTVGGRRIGMGEGSNKKAAMQRCYVDVTQYLEQCDPELWSTFVKNYRPGAPTGLAPHIVFQMSDELDDELRDVIHDIRDSKLYARRPRVGTLQTAPPSRPASPPGPKIPRGPRGRRPPNAAFLEQKSAKLLEDLRAYESDPKLEKMRAQRASLPVTTKASEILAKVELNEVTICMAATGSGKTTQIPQLILDDAIQRGEGARCNVICTQPRRIAAISVAQRVANERGETLGGTIGYQVRFDSRLPRNHGSVTFCTTGVFLRRMQTALQETERPGGAESPAGYLDDVTHIVVDEVHERDVDTDLTLVVLKRLIEDRRRRGKPIKVILMSATIDADLFQRYFADTSGRPAPVAEVPGRSFPVTKRYLDDYIGELQRLPSQMGGWVWSEKNVTEYVQRELHQGASAPGKEELEIPYSLVALTIAHVLQQTHDQDGHVLVFLPGWDEIKAVQNILLDRGRYPLLGINFADTSKYSVHVLHSTVPIAEQQQVFEPAAQGVRRVILATNIAETSVTIPDVVFVVDSGRVKEKRYDPERHMSSLVSAWVGTSNLNQRAGRAGRHREGEYYGVLSRARFNALDPYQLVEMKRVDLSEVVLRVKALDFPGMEVEDVLAQAIEPPAPERIAAAMERLFMIGALDAHKQLTSLGRVLLQLPCEAPIGKLCLYGSFFRCLDSALTLAAVLTNRDPFLAPIALKNEANAIKASWSPKEFRSDVFAIVRAFDAWWAMQSRGEYVSANRFASENFLSKPTLLQIQQVKEHLFQSLEKLGVTSVSAAGDRMQPGSNLAAHSVYVPPSRRDRDGGSSVTIPPELNTNGDSLPLLAALVAMASAPNFAIRTSDKTYRTSQEKVAFIHPSSVNHKKRELPDGHEFQPGEKQLFAFQEKTRNTTVGGSSSAASTMLRMSTRLDPLTYMLFGAYNLRVTERGLECDDWLPVVGNLDALDDLQRLKTLVDACMLRVFEGLHAGAASHGGRDRYGRPVRGSRQQQMAPPRGGLGQDHDGDGDSSEEEEEDSGDLTLSPQEQLELDRMSTNVVRLLELYSSERGGANGSRFSSRPATPGGGGYASPGGYGGPSRPSGFVQGPPGGWGPPPGGSAFSSRSHTPAGPPTGPLADRWR